MRRLLAAAASILMAATLTTTIASPAEASAAPEIKVLTYNIRNPDGVIEYGAGRSWDNRKAGVYANIEQPNPDIFFVQEASTQQGEDPAEDLKAHFATTPVVYDVMDWGNSSPKLIFWEDARFNEVPGRRGDHLFTRVNATENADCEGQTRRMQYTVLEDTKNNNARYFVVSTHFHTICQDYREDDARQVHETIAAANPENYPVIMGGDFNNRPEACYGTAGKGTPIDILSAPQATYNLNTESPANNCAGTTNKGWDNDRTNDNSRIDFIWHTADLDHSLYTIHNDFNVTLDGSANSPSDHYAISMKLTPVP